MSNTFKFNGSIVKSIRDYNNVVKATVVDRRIEMLPDGNMSSKFTASRQITITDPTLLAWVRTNLNATDEFAVNLEGYLTSTYSEKNKKWYDNQIVTAIELV